MAFLLFLKIFFGVFCFVDMERLNKLNRSASCTNFRQ